MGDLNSAKPIPGVYCATPAVNVAAACEVVADARVTSFTPQLNSGTPRASTDAFSLVAKPKKQTATTGPNAAIAPSTTTSGARVSGGAVTGAKVDPKASAAVTAESTAAAAVSDALIASHDAAAPATHQMVIENKAIAVVSTTNFTDTATRDKAAAEAAKLIQDAYLSTPRAQTMLARLNADILKRHPHARPLTMSDIAAKYGAAVTRANAGSVGGERRQLALPDADTMVKLVPNVLRQASIAAGWPRGAYAEAMAFVSNEIAEARAEHLAHSASGDPSHPSVSVLGSDGTAHQAPVIAAAPHKTESGTLEVTGGKAIQLEEITVYGKRLTKPGDSYMDIVVQARRDDHRRGSFVEKHRAPVVDSDPVSEYEGPEITGRQDPAAVAKSLLGDESSGKHLKRGAIASQETSRKDLNRRAFDVALREGDTKRQQGRPVAFVREVQAQRVGPRGETQAAIQQLAYRGRLIGTG